MLCGEVSHVFRRGPSEHEHFDWHILEAWADDGDELFNVFLVGKFDFQIGGHGDGQTFFASNFFDIEDIGMFT